MCRKPGNVFFVLCYLHRDTSQLMCFLRFVNSIVRKARQCAFCALLPASRPKPANVLL